MELAGKSAKAKLVKSTKPKVGAVKRGRGRPSVKADLKLKSAKKKSTSAEIFQDRESVDVWIRERLGRHVDDYDFLIDQLRLDLKANSDAAAKLIKEGKQVSSELLRNRQSLLTSMRTLMGGTQELMISLMKSKNLMGDLGGEDEGGDVVINVQPLPPEESTDGGSE